MLRTATSSVLIYTEDGDEESHDSNASIEFVSCPEVMDNHQKQPASTPKATSQAKGAKKDSSRRRPNLPTTSGEQLHAVKKACLETAKRQAEEEHSLAMQIMKERLKQEKIKTAMLERELAKVEGRS